MIDPAQAVTIGTVLGAATVYILRERSKSKNEKSNNGHLKIIVEKMATKEQLQKTNGKLTKIDKAVGLINGNVKNIKENCKATTERFEKDINENQADIKNILKDNRP